ncbi:MAG: ArsB/NhaD family transporter [Clostridia bacterium]
MALSISMLVVSCVSIVIFTALNLTVKIKKIKIHLYWIVPAICALVLLSVGEVSWAQFGEHLTNASNMNPLKVLALFLSMSALSVFLDQAGLFRYLASRALKSASASQIKLFVALYFVIAILTLVTSNSTIILTFTPFICYFAKNSGINPIPFLFTEFVSANTWSMFFLIGNTTNTYIASAFNISFIEYTAMMALPTIFASITSFAILFLMFKKDLKQPLSAAQLDVEIKNKPALIVGVVGMTVCTLLLIISSYIGLQMWLISLICASTVMIVGTICYLCKKQGLKKIGKTLRRMPWHLAPFLLSMYVIVMSLDNSGVTDIISKTVFNNNLPILTFGGLSALVSNFMNNIPMSILFANILLPLEGKALVGGIYATVIGSNLGNMITPIASMSAIMFRSVIKHKHVTFTFLDFVKKGFWLATTTLFAALGGLAIMMII